MEILKNYKYATCFVPVLHPGLFYLQPKKTFSITAKPSSKKKCLRSTVAATTRRIQISKSTPGVSHSVRLRLPTS